MALIDRPSRFDDVILFQLPDLELRFSILDKVGKEMNIENRNKILKDLAEKTEGLTGSHLKEIMVYALLLAADSERENITEDDLAQALIKVLDTKETITDKLSEVNVKCLMDEIKNTKESNNDE
jgi:ATP-dependent 26S proteasome regulatory subunit